jgi:hypothetical protein
VTSPLLRKFTPSWVFHTSKSRLSLHVPPNRCASTWSCHTCIPRASDWPAENNIHPTTGWKRRNVT